MNLILVDLNSLAFASQESTKLSLENGFETQAIFSTLRTIRKIKTDHPDRKMICLDDGRSQWRYDLYPQYKGNRESTPEKKAEREKLKAQKPYIVDALRFLGVEYWKSPIAEADDLAGSIVTSLKGENDFVLITSDKDWLQLVAKNVLWEDPKFQRNCDLASFETFTGCKNAQQFVDIKALMGDSSDNVPGVGGIGEKGAKDLLNTFGSVDVFLTEFDEGRLLNQPKALTAFGNNEIPKPSKKYGELLPMRQAFARNRKLMDLRNNDNKIYGENMIRDKGEFSQTGFENLCFNLEFNSILADLENFMKPFGE